MAGVCAHLRELRSWFLVARTCSGPTDLRAFDNRPTSCEANEKSVLFHGLLHFERFLLGNAIVSSAGMIGQREAVYRRHFCFVWLLEPRGK